MVRSKNPPTWRIAGDIQQRTLQEFVNIGISITFECNDCNHIAVWPWPWMKRERKLQPLMSKRIEDFARQLRCVGCQSDSFYARAFVETDARRMGR